jgi:hypothetical protein
MILETHPVKTYKPHILTHDDDSMSSSDFQTKDRPPHPDLRPVPAQSNIRQRQPNLIENGTTRPVVTGIVSKLAIALV